MQQIKNAVVAVFAFVSRQFNRLPSELRYAYYTGSSAILSLLIGDIQRIADGETSSYVQAVLTFFVVNTIQYVVVKLGDKAELYRQSKLS